VTPPHPPDSPPELKTAFGFEDDSWQSKLASAVAVRLPDPPRGYELLEKVGEGGQGTVFRARQSDTGRIVAAKRLFGGPAAASARFDREIFVLSTFSHPAIVSVVAAERASDQRWLILDWIEGRSIDAWADALPRSADSLRTLLATFIEICDGVQHAHSRGVIHRDIKPSNVLIDEASRPRILDFGIAKLIDERAGASHTTTGSFLGTLGYAAPEQLTLEPGFPQPADTRVDVYSIGALLYRVLTGTDPAAASAGPNPTPAQIFKLAAEHRTPPRPSLANPLVTRDLDAVTLKALCPDPSARYATVDALRLDLEALLDNRPVMAQPPTLRYLARMFVRRQRVAVSIASIAVLLILALTVFLGVLSLQLSRRGDQLALSTLEAQEQKQAALVLAERRSKMAEALSTMVESLASTYAGESTIESLDQKLRLAAAQIDSGVLAGDIEAEILLRGKLRATMHDRGMLKDALEQSQKHLDLTSERSGPTSRAVASSLIYQAAIYGDLGDYAAAERAARLAIEYDLALKEPGSLPNTGHMSTLAGILHAQGKYAEAEHFFRGRLDGLLSNPKHSRTAVARARRNVAQELLYQGKLEDAEQLVNAAIKTLAEAAPKDASAEENLHRARRVLALIRLRQGKIDEAESLQRDVVNSMVSLHGGKHYALLQERVHLAEILLAGSRVDAAKRTEAMELLDATEKLYSLHVQPSNEFLVQLRRLREHPDGRTGQ
jgi:tetratricopeptide (TPR) repeat protein